MTDILALFGFRRVKVDTQVPNFDLTPTREYADEWERKRLPSPGTGPYAYETMALSQYAPAGPTVPVRTTIRATPATQQTYIPVQSVNVDGMATTAAQFYLSPLFDPATGTVGIKGV